MPDIITSVNTLEIPEGGQAAFNVKLSSKPEDRRVKVRVARVSGDADITVASGATLEFKRNKYNRWQTVTLAASEDADSENGQAVFRLTGHDLDSAEVTAMEKDKDEFGYGYQIVTDTDAVTIMEGGKAMFNVSLNKYPGRTIALTVGRYSGDEDIEVVGGSTIYFNETNWNKPQTVTLSAAEDTDETNGEAVFALSADGAETVYISAFEEEPAPGTETAGRVVIDPVSRIEGHLRVEVEVSGGKVDKAWSSATLFRGIEKILAGRDPRDAPIITQRLCGVCTYVHQLCSVRAIEDAVGCLIPENARLVRNLTLGAQFLHDHIVHFYHLHGLDWVDVTSALSADPAAAENLAISISPDADWIDFAAVKSRLQGLVDTGNLGPFANAYWGHSEYSLSPEQNLLVTAHYLEALKLQVTAAKMMAILGGKNPHPQSTIVGGVTCGGELSAERLNAFRDYLAQTRRFVDTVYMPDLKVMAGLYNGWKTLGGFNNFLACGEFQMSDSETDLLMPRGVISNGDIFNVEPLDEALISEHVARSWYAGTDSHPLDGDTIPEYTGMNVDESYSYFKAPRYDRQAMEVGPLARVLIGYGMGKPEFVNEVQSFLLDFQSFFPDKELTEADLLSTLGRTAARAIETKIIGNAMVNWLNELEGNLAAGDKEIYYDYTMSSRMGRGLLEAPRGALGHWISIQNEAIDRYQMVVPTTWNLGPRCGEGIAGPMEQALVGVPVAEAEKPVEVLRVIHSFDPCVACGVHVIDKENDKAYEIKVI